MGDGSRKQLHVWRDSLLLTLKELRQKQRYEGFRGWNRLQANDLLIYEALLARMDAETGKLYPELVTIAADAGLSKQTVIDALKRIGSHGFISWVRRSKVVPDNEGQAGPQRAQTSNAYFIDFRALRAKCKQAWFRVKALVSRRLKGLGAAIAKLAKDVTEGSELALALSRVERLVLERESNIPALPPRRG